MRVSGAGSFRCLLCSDIDWTLPLCRKRVNSHWNTVRNERRALLCNRLLDQATRHETQTRSRCARHERGSDSRFLAYEYFLLSVDNDYACVRFGVPDSAAKAASRNDPCCVVLSHRLRGHLHWLPLPTRRCRRSLSCFARNFRHELVRRPSSQFHQQIQIQGTLATSAMAKNCSVSALRV